MTPPPTGSAPSTGSPICSAARRWSNLWSELDLSRARVVARAPHVKARQSGPHMELVPQLFDLNNGRRYISIGLKYDQGPGSHRQLDSVGFGQFLHLPLADWAVADQLWSLLRIGDLGVSFDDLDVINGGFDPGARKADQLEKDRWVQKVWDLKVRLEQKAREDTRHALRRINSEIRSRPGAVRELRSGGTVLPAILLGPDVRREAVTRFRINQGMYGDHTLFIDRPEEGWMRVHQVPAVPMFRRAGELHRDLTGRWLGAIGDALDDLVAATSGKEGAAFARAIESSRVVGRLDDIVETFWAMWRQPFFSANSEFEVVTDPERRAAKYMEILIQRSLRILLKQAMEEEIGRYPYEGIDRFNYRDKIRVLEEAVGRAVRILELYGQVQTVPAFKRATRVRDRLVQEFHTVILEGSRPGHGGRALGVAPRG